jgi:hypothetical protein
MNEVNLYIHKTANWRILRALGDSIFILSRVLDLPNEKINLYIRNTKEGWYPTFKKLINISEGGERITLHPPGESPKGEYEILKINGDQVMEKGFDYLAKNDDVDFAEIDWSKVDYNKETLDSIDFEKTICWSARYNVRPGRSRRNFDKLPDCLVKKYPNYNFINIGMPVVLSRPTWEEGRFIPAGATPSHGKGSHTYDLHTTAWIIKKSHKFAGIDSGGTHFAMMIKEPKDVLYFGQTYTEAEQMLIKKGVTCLR